MARKASGRIRNYVMIQVSTEIKQYISAVSKNDVSYYIRELIVEDAAKRKVSLKNRASSDCSGKTEQ